MAEAQHSQEHQGLRPTAEDVALEIWGSSTTLKRISQVKSILEIYEKLRAALEGRK